MGDKRVHLVYFSPTTTSRQIAEAVGEGCGTGALFVTDLTCGEPEEFRVGPDEVVVIAVPVYGGRVAETALERLQGIKGERTPVILVVVYGNRDYEDALLELKDYAVSAGFLPLVAGAFIGEHSYSQADKPIAAGRPDVEDRKKAIGLGRKAMEKLRQGKAWESLVVKGNFPYKAKGPKTPATPETSAELCINCGYCIEKCPVQAIRETAGRIVSDADLCIKCCACVKQCPQGARIFHTPYTDLLFAKCSVRREPELFF